MKTLLIILTILICLGVTSVVYGNEYKDAPLPHYTEERGYGWSTEVPVDKPENVWNILKTWRIGKTLEVFLDKDRVG